MRPIIFDLEIVRAIPPRNGAPLPGVQYCEGWHDHQNMGISVLGLEDLTTGDVHVLCEDNKEVLLPYIEDSEVLFVGFNSINFDAKVILANWGMQIPLERHYDILRELWAAHGLGPEFQPKTHGGFSLDATASVNGFGNKTGDGALAPVLWQQRKIGTVINYCLHDVSLTRKLFDEILSFGALKSPKTGKEVLMSDPLVAKSFSSPTSPTSSPSEPSPTSASPLSQSAGVVK